MVRASVSSWSVLPLPDDHGDDKDVELELVTVDGEKASFALEPNQAGLLAQELQKMATSVASARRRSN
jgi:hypothetical protein